MGAMACKSKATPTTTPMPLLPPPWAALTPKLVLHIFRRLSSHADRVRFASVCRHWRHIAKRFMRWSDLPPKIADRIVRRLHDEADRIRFAAVCRHWHNIASKFWSPWSRLPPDLALLVLHRVMYSHTDRVSFAAVCRNWRYVAKQYSPPLPPALPWVCNEYGICQSLPDCNVHILRPRERNKVCCGSFGNWLLFKEVIGSSSRVLENPFSGAKLFLPAQCNEPVYLFSNGTHSTPSNSRSTCFNIHKVIVCAGDLIAAMVSYLFRPKSVVFYRQGMSSWSTGLWNANQYQDMALHMGKLYTVANGGDLFLHEVIEDHNTGEPMVSRIQRVIQAPPRMDGYYRVLEEETRCYLVISVTGKLLLVRWFVPFRSSFEDTAKHLRLEVFEADFERALWVEVERLDDQVLFVSSRCSKAMSASTDCDYLQGNKIYVLEVDLSIGTFGRNIVHPSVCTICAAKLLTQYL